MLLKKEFDDFVINLCYKLFEGFPVEYIDRLQKEASLEVNREFFDKVLLFYRELLFMYYNNMVLPDEDTVENVLVYMRKFKADIVAIYQKSSAMIILHSRNSIETPLLKLTDHKSKEFSPKAKGRLKKVNLHLTHVDEVTLIAFCDMVINYLNGVMAGLIDKFSKIFSNDTTTPFIKKNHNKFAGTSFDADSPTWVEDFLSTKVDIETSIEIDTLVNEFIAKTFI